MLNLILYIVVYRYIQNIILQKLQRSKFLLELLHKSRSYHFLNNNYLKSLIFDMFYLILLNHNNHIFKIILLNPLWYFCILFCNYDILLRLLYFQRLIFGFQVGFE